MRIHLYIKPSESEEARDIGEIELPHRPMIYDLIDFNGAGSNETWEAAQCRITHVCFDLDGGNKSSDKPSCSMRAYATLVGHSNINGLTDEENQIIALQGITDDFAI